MVHCGLDLVLMGVGFHFQFVDLLNYDQKSFILLLQLVVAPCASILALALSSE